MRVQLAGSDLKRSYGLPYQRLINYLLEPIDGGKAMRFPRPGLSEAYTIGTGPIRGIYRVSGLFSSDVFAVSGTTLYRGASAIGSVLGTDGIRWASSASQLVFCANGQAYLYDGTTLVPIILPDGQQVSDVVYLAGRFVYSISADDRFYWSAVNDAANINPLNYATAESGADAIVGMSTLVDDLYLFGAESTEPWSTTTDASLPFQRPPGRRYNRGCASQYTIVQADNSLFWVGEDRIFYRSGAVPQRVSDFGVEERLARCSNIALSNTWSVTVQGHILIVLNIPGEGSMCLDLSNNRWTEWSSYQRALFRGRCAQMVDGASFIGDDQTGAIWTLEVGNYADGGSPITWLASFWIDQPGSLARLDNIVLQGSRGVGTLVGQGVDPMAVLRLSDDQGMTFGSWMTADLGERGDYTDRAVWMNLGMIAEPGILGEVRTTDPVLCAMIQLLVNVPRPYG